MSSVCDEGLSPHVWLPTCSKNSFSGERMDLFSLILPCLGQQCDTAKLSAASFALVLQEPGNPRMGQTEPWTCRCSTPASRTLHYLWNQSCTRYTLPSCLPVGTVPWGSGAKTVWICFLNILKSLVCAVELWTDWDLLFWGLCVVFVVFGMLFPLSFLRAFFFFKQG